MTVKMLFPTEAERVQPPTTMLRVSWIPLNGMGDDSGYGKVGHYLWKSMEKAGAYTCLKRDFDWDVRIGVGGPRAWLVGKGDAVHGDLIFHTMFEARPIPPDWVPVLNRAGAVWVPAKWNEEIFRESGVTAPIFVSGYGVADKEFAFIPRQREEGTPYTFLWAGTSFGERVEGVELGDRKGGDIVLSAFRKLNLRDARLVLKATDRSLYTSLTGDARISLLTGKMDIWQYRALLALADCFVYPSHGEGFGLQPLEAMATGLPAIVTAYSGMMEFLSQPLVGTEAWALPLPVAGEETSQAFTRVYGENGGNPGYEARWARISTDDVCDRMRWCYEHRVEAAAIGKRAAEVIAAQWTWDQAGQRGLAKVKGFLKGEI